MSEWEQALTEIAALIDERQKLRIECGVENMAKPGPEAVSAAIRTVLLTRKEKNQVVSENPIIKEI